MAGNVAEWVQDVYRPIIDNRSKMILIFQRKPVYQKIKLVPMVKLKLLPQHEIRYLVMVEL
jgi:hypothetical protein